MFDRAATALIKPLVDRGAALALRAGISANQLTLGGFALGMLAAWLVGCGQFGGAVLAMLLSRLCDALDGAAARQSRVTDAGAFLDITLDFLFYAAVALAFAARDVAPLGTALWARDPLRGRDVQVRVESPVHFDAAGERLRGRY